MKTTDNSVLSDNGTEGRNPRSFEIDRMSPLGVLELINDEDAGVAAVVRTALPVLSEAVDEAEKRFRRGGNVHYFGAGTSGRFGVLDSAEIPPTFGIPGHRFTAHLAGGEDAMIHAVEAAEDDEQEGQAAAAALGPDDIAIGITASGSTPYVGAALRTARSSGAMTLLLSSNEDTSFRAFSDFVAVLDTGNEVLSGSTRMKAATAQKMALTAFSTTLMVRLGRTYSNLMVDVVPFNAKLRRRSLAILRHAADLDESTAAEIMKKADGELKLAIVMGIAKTDAPTARTALQQAGGVAYRAIGSLLTEKSA
ncbi:N-acetylmuramic acid 6-phosphate etherase [Paracoccus aerodenitrificans]|uniref:N-acetylmuramic acid 6-phosphate etherase n=1 Tax=Paracoccus aerodenitrificans TaxID=3017781 RepID=UPI0022F10763|nr:N-acetylmuramic acid 6-phosphate etherase [Paracoccus aerodenitrificans]WBU64131.1 N-acetylmuramic acid 6-phosphate etherase [Paracoccus aerodenitrificans]